MEFLPAFLNKEDTSPLYYQLYSYLAGEIRAGNIPPKDKLPGKRTAAAQLGISVNTVDEAYQMLAAEGYVTAKPRSGFVVEALSPQQVPRPAAGQGALRTPCKTAPESQAEKYLYNLSSGGQDAGLFPQKAWNRLLREVLADEPFPFARGGAFGEEVLRTAIAAYLQSYRGVKCGAGQIVVGAGLEVLLGMLARLMPEKTWAAENPGYPGTARVLANMGVPLCHVEMDEDGMMPQKLTECGAQMAYVTPSHQFPTGRVMPAGRRTALLHWAAASSAESPRYIVEDDYDSEFRFSGRPLPSLQGLDEGGRVIYAGTFSRSLAAGLRCAYLVLPPAVLPLWQKTYGSYACTVSRPEQQTLARLMQSGTFARSINRMRASYRTRRDAVLAAIEKYFPKGKWHAKNTHTGLYFILHLPGQNAAALAKAARQNGLRLHALDEYYTAPPQNSPTANALIIGYGGIAEDDIADAVKLLAGLAFG